MPSWASTEDVGVLLLGPAGLVLARPDGGTWRLAIPWWRRPRRFIGRRVRIRGIRTGFDVIDVDRITPL